ncbi:hypothetical protein N0V90_010743 [Kalmusia sp. IMI 367209]|nr:hypothetical protein N0V90_010743 [Kalmusia sp. IMI 367209]
MAPFQNPPRAQSDIFPQGAPRGHNVPAIFEQWCFLLVPANGVGRTWKLLPLWPNVPLLSRKKRPSSPNDTPDNSVPTSTTELASTITSPSPSNPTSAAEVDPAHTHTATTVHTTTQATAPTVPTDINTRHNRPSPERQVRFDENHQQQSDVDGRSTPGSPESSIDGEDFAPSLESSVWGTSSAMSDWDPSRPHL